MTASERAADQVARETKQSEDETSCSPTSEASSNEPDKKKRKRASRWSDAPASTASAIRDGSLVQYAMRVYGSTDLTDDQWKQLEDQRKMSLLAEMITSKQRAAAAAAAAASANQQDKRPKYEYDSDEEIDQTEGTWEHQRRRREMEQTIDKAHELTSRGRGKHHLGDFLPPEELSRFFSQWESIKDGGAAVRAASDWEEFKLKEDNRGFRMLEKMGWSSGQGLGSAAEGITEPVNRSTGPVPPSAGADRSGLGIERPDALQSGDDEFDAYRKRMMLAYRFRPNPLVSTLDNGHHLTLTLFFFCAE